MTTNVFTLKEYAEMLMEIAEDWDEDPPAVLVGDVTGSLNIGEKDGYTKHGAVGYASECFDSNGVHELSQGDTRFYGTMLMERENLTEEAQEALAERD